MIPPSDGGPDDAGSSLANFAVHNVRADVSANLGADVRVAVVAGVGGEIGVVGHRLKR